MFRIAVAGAFLVSSQASRVQVHEVDTAQVKWGATCEDLQSRFRDRVTTIRSSLEGEDEHSELGAVAQTRLAMRMHGILRTLRRARECSWVIENNSDDLDQLRGVVQQLLTANPCAEAARLEFESGSSDENPQAVQHALTILLSDDCVALPVPEGANTDVTPEEQLQAAEDEFQDSLDEPGDSGESAFIEVDKTQFFRALFRAIGVAFLMLFLLLACVTTAAAIALVLSAVLSVLAYRVGLYRPAGRGLFGPHFPIAILGGFGGAVIGLGACAATLQTTLLPRLS